MENSLLLNTHACYISFFPFQTLFFTGTDPFFPNHPVLKLGVTVQIGLDKSCKLSTVFERYVEFCNEQQQQQGDSDQNMVVVKDLEFLHTQVLSGHDTVEAAALMKNDRISVRREQSHVRLEEEAANKLQRDLDCEFFQQLRQMLPNQNLKVSVDEWADTVLDCRGSLMNIRSNECLRLETTIKCHSVLIYKRCPWLRRMIDASRQENARRSVVTVPEATKQEFEDEDFELMQQIKVEPVRDDESAVAQIENDDDDQVNNPENSLRRASRNSDVVMGEDDASFSADDMRQLQAADANLVWTVIENHPPEAMLLLLEYCYSNRVVPLGCEAFVASCKTKPQNKKLHGPVPPFELRPTRWPNGGEPTVTFAVAIAGMQLAEEAEMPRLSFMCEIAAAQLVDPTCAVDALAACETQRQLTGNSLPRLRKATMDIVFRAQIQSDKGASNLLKKALRVKGPLLIPTLITGAMEAVEAGEKKKQHHSHSSFLTGEKRDWQTMAYSYFDKFDKIDAKERDRERRKSRGGGVSEEEDKSSAIFADDELFSLWGESGARRLSLKRMSHHLGGAMGNRVVANLPRRGGNSSKSNTANGSAAHRRGLR